MGVCYISFDKTLLWADILSGQWHNTLPFSPKRFALFGQLVFGVVHVLCNKSCPF